MLERTLIGLATLSAFTLGFRSVQAQSTFKSGYYAITGGLYTECCGIAANTFSYELPDERLGFVELIVDPGGHTARLTFLNPDLRTVFTSYPWFPEETFAFSFNNGIVFSDYIQFRVIPGFVALRKVNPDIFRMREQRFEPALTCAGVQHPFPRRNFGGDATNKAFDGGFERVQATIQTGRKQAAGACSQSGTKQARKLSGSDCRAYRARRVCGRHRGSTSRSDPASYPDWSACLRHE